MYLANSEYEKLEIFERKIRRILSSRKIAGQYRRLRIIKLRKYK